MTRTKASSIKGRETKDKRREKDRKAREHTRKIIKGILGETGKDRMYEARGKGKGKRQDKSISVMRCMQFEKLLIVPRQRQVHNALRHTCRMTK